MRTLYGWLLLGAVTLVAAPVVYKHAVSGPQCERLDIWYAGYNEQYFDNKLPKDTIVDYSESDPDTLAATTEVNGRFHIAFNPKLATSAIVAHTFLIHEMAHICSWDETQKHGPKWKACMYHAVSKGAIVEQMIESYND